MAVDLYFLLVENIAGSFLVSILLLVALFFIIFMLAGVSLWTAVQYNEIFVLAMAIGWGYGNITILLTIGILFHFFMTGKGMVERSGGNW
jgi:hypothetical protein